MKFEAITQVVANNLPAESICNQSQVTKSLTVLK